MGRTSRILGISAFYHDAAAALIEDGRLVAAAQEERFTRRKGDPQLPRHAVNYCLAEAGIELGDVDCVAFYEKPWLHFERILDAATSFAPRGVSMFVRAMPEWLVHKFFMRRTLRRGLKYEGEVLFCQHHESHMGAAFYPSPFERAAILTVDGVGEWATATWGRGEGASLEPGGELRFPHSLGLLYSAFTAYLGFEVNEGEYKVMGLAPYGEPKFASKIRDELVELRADGSIRLNLDYFPFTHEMRMTNDRFHDLFGAPPRQPESELTQRDADLAASIQQVTEEVLLAMARHAHAETGESRLVLGGGVAHNSVANGRLLRESPFDEIWVQPASGDAGSAIGCALVAWHQARGQARDVEENDGQRGSYLGPAFTRDAAKSDLDRHGAVYRELDEASVAEAVAEAIDDQRVVGAFFGRMEFGARALGHRSILADARPAEMKDVLNAKIKRRESFRPFAPAVLASRAAEFFDHRGESPYMLFVSPVQSGRLTRAATKDPLGRTTPLESDIAAVTHFDGTARLQTVDSTRSPHFNRILEAFERRTGCPVIVNTSFNVRGEPIVCTPDDAYRCFMTTDMDVLVVGDLLLEKTEQPPWQERPRPPSPWSPPSDVGRYRAFGFAGAVIIAAFALWGAWSTQFELTTSRIAALCVAGSFFLLGLLVPNALRPIYRVLERVGAIPSGLLLGSFFFTVVTPIGLLRRFGKEDSMGRRSAGWSSPSTDARGKEGYRMQW